MVLVIEMTFFSYNLIKKKKKKEKLNNARILITLFMYK